VECDVGGGNFGCWLSKMGARRGAFWAAWDGRESEIVAADEKISRNQHAIDGGGAECYDRGTASLDRFSAQREWEVSGTINLANSSSKTTDNPPQETGADLFSGSATDRAADLVLLNPACLHKRLEKRIGAFQGM
jgi:hypothetical protein